MKAYVEGEQRHERVVEAIKLVDHGGGCCLFYGGWGGYAKVVQDVWVGV